MRIAHDHPIAFLLYCSAMNHGIGVVSVPFTLLPEPEFVNVSLSIKLVQITYCTCRNFFLSTTNQDNGKNYLPVACRLQESIPGLLKR